MAAFWAVPQRVVWAVFWARFWAKVRTKATRPCPRATIWPRRICRATNDASFGELFNDSLTTGADPEVAPTPEQNAMAGLLLRAMIQAAKSDGKIDDAEKQRLLAEIGDLDEAERAFIREEMSKPVDAEALARETPQGMGPQVYLMSLMAIDFDNEAEARYLHALAEALGLDHAQVNEIHGQVGVQNLYA
ncbi:tellurite resistance TerB family protein [Paracoccus sp. DMF-8]|uniref:tellurite resistance TerB family protein n=1 Tax=Paracoccus sp. DMF-8 TaxID=3019445 RepID=UPI0023E85961|nr:tellurite resistance TerB family protein [Paracoccus sp. DMF-8]MDF3604822.1 tellurite resistance TerB family protein [Paracoccus sp. DMF-8]